MHFLGSVTKNAPIAATFSLEGYIWPQMKDITYRLFLGKFEVHVYLGLAIINNKNWSKREKCEKNHIF